MQKLVSDKYEIASYLSRASRQGRNYSNIVGWTLYTGFKGRTTKLAIAIGLSLLNLVCQAAAIGAVYWYGHTWQRPATHTCPICTSTLI